MGCDIHYFVEVQQEDNSWKTLEVPDWRNYKTHQEWEEACPKWHYHHRNYSVFAVLADVRNGRGFAGCDLGDPVTPIFPPRGLPADVSAETKAASDDWGRDGHSHSHLTVRELLDYDWGAPQTVREVIPLAAYAKYFETGEVGFPEACSFIRGRNIKTVAENIAREILLGKRTKEDNIEYHVKVQYQVPIRETCRYFHDTVIPALVGLGDPDRVRIVFFFDN
jgi:hypothetical protein